MFSLKEALLKSSGERGISELLTKPHVLGTLPKSQLLSIGGLLALNSKN